MTGSISDSVRVFADFDMYNKDILLNILDEQRQKGYVLKKTNTFFGVLTFEALSHEENIVYAVIRPSEYKNGGILPDPWRKCGRMGDYIIYRSSGYAAVPESDQSPADHMKSMKILNIINGILWMLIFIGWLCMDIPKMFGSAIGFSEYFGFTFIRDIFCGINAAAYLGKAFSKTNRSRAGRGGYTYARQYILPYIFIAAITALLIAGICTVQTKEIPIPDSRIPLSDRFDRCEQNSNFAARRYYLSQKQTAEVYLGGFMYKYYFDGLSQKVFREIGEEQDGFRLNKKDIFFRNYNTFEPIDPSPYNAIDEIYICGENSTVYDLVCTGIIIRSGNTVCGVSYRKNTVSDEDVLTALNDYFKAIKI